MLRTFAFLLLLTTCEMIKDGNVSIVLFDGLCPNTDNDLNKLVNSELQLANKYIFRQICMEENGNIETIIKNDTVDMFIGTMNLENDKKYMKFAEFFNRPYISPSGIDRHKDGEILWSLGANYQRVATVLGIVLTHFKWRKVLLITEERSEYVTFGNEMFIELAHDGFRPTIEYVRNDFGDTEIENLLSKVTDQQKGVVLLARTQMRDRIIALAGRQENFAEKHSLFILETNPYLKPNIEYFNDTVFANTTSGILHSIFHLYPSFDILDRKVTKRSTKDPTISLQRITRQTRSVSNDDISVINFIYDAVMAIDTLISDKNVSDLGQLFHLLANRTFQLYSGKIRTDISNNVLFDFVLSDLDIEKWESNQAQEIKQLQDSSWEIIGLREVRWPNDQVLGPDESFYLDSCRQESEGMDALYILAIAIAVLFVAGVATAIIIAVWRKIIHRDMSKGQHKVLLTKDDLVFLSKRDVQKGSKLMNGNSNLIDRPDLIKDSSGRTATNRSMVSLHEYADITDTARYNGDLVHVKELKMKTFEMKSKVLHVIKTLKDVRHENVNLFVGFYDDQNVPAIITDFCSRGSLEDVLNNSDIKLDWDFKVSLLTDLIRGVRYIHNSSLRWHGNLKCRNCLIDSRWVLKVSDFGLPNLYGAIKFPPKFQDSDLLCMAPEHLRDPVPGLKGSEKGDVYSISIIMQCVVLRSGPYSTSGLTPSEILHKLKHPPPLLRPSVSHGTAPPQYIQLMKVCWTENPEMRPGMEEIYQQFKTFTGGKKMNIVDTMFRMLEKYSTDLEDLVKDRTLQLEEEKKKTELLLYRMLPRVVADSLKCGRTVQAEQFSEVTIYFSDIVGFTTISANSTPMQVVDLLNDLYTMFDATIDAYDVYKVETIGDAYMVCSGLPIRNGNRHAGEISTMALDLLSQCGNFTIKHMHEVPLRVRIGLHSGPAVAGVVGLTMPRYCLFGDTVNTASRMESTGAAYRIHISDTVKIILDSLGGYQTEYRGEVELKGKGMAKTYWLTGKDGFTKELPDPPPLTTLSLEKFIGGAKKGKADVSKLPSKRISSTASPFFRSKTHVLEDSVSNSKLSEQRVRNSIIHVSPKQESQDSRSNLNDNLNVTDVKCQSEFTSEDIDTREYSPIDKHQQGMTKADLEVVNTQTECIQDQYVCTDHIQNSAIDNNKDLCNSKETTRQLKSDLDSLNENDIDDHVRESKISVKPCNTDDRHVTFRKLRTKDIVKNTLNEDSEYVITNVKNKNGSFDIHDINLNSPKRKTIETRTRKSSSTSPRIKSSSGVYQNKSRKPNETNNGSKRRRSSFQESLV
ncbi:retinal guanylyl cyclase 2-like isoform X2 [Mercenaria mercenaria]|uniref:retinal guanylyl cyclase 2-like isoform X2 n=1 Tax=Mercenaria mercenaria TaxID=6596 RepID=UPI00234EBE45|nr:retinal guanylyl cyclase 2-like isoform X2 [Mercenaria mercenaria]